MPGPSWFPNAMPPRRVIHEFMMRVCAGTLVNHGQLVMEPAEKAISVYRVSHVVLFFWDSTLSCYFGTA
jgi:hypothetical protein